MDKASTPASGFTSYQKLVVAILAFLQFTIVLDFMILSPLGAWLMPALRMEASQFSMVVSGYAFSAGASGVLAAGLADRFDRKKMLLFFYVGFLVGTLLCGLAGSYEALLTARIVTGIFGGVIGSIVLAIAADLFPYHMRGRVMGVVQTAFATSQILGIPVGLYLTRHWSWHAPFFLIVGVGLVVGSVIFVVLKPMNAHLENRKNQNPFVHLLNTLKNRRYLAAFGTMALLATGGFMIMPFSSAFTVHNVGIANDRLPTVYLATGIVAIIAGPLIGRACDRIGKFPVFVIGSVMSAVMVLIYSNMGLSHIMTLIVVSAIMFVGISSRIISSQALMSAVPTPSDRGAFMSINSSVQQFSGGIASVIAGHIVVVQTDGKLLHFDILGYVVTVAVFVTAVCMYRVSRMVNADALENVPVKSAT